MLNASLGATLLALSHIFSGGGATHAPAVANLNAETRLLSQESPDVDPQALKLGLEAYDKARQQGLDPQQILTIVDYSRPSTEPRLVVYDLKSNDVLFQALVAHGRNSGDNLPDSFSDDPSSHKSSLGLFVTGEPYIGHHGYSLRLDGLEKGFNDKAASREIVVHAANYVSAQFAEVHGRLGRSWGCFAVNPTVAKPIINTIKDGSLLFAYYPDRNWLEHSSYLT
jgi:hypothetical protein